MLNKNTEIQHCINKAIKLFDGGQINESRDLLRGILLCDKNNLIALEIISFIESYHGNFNLAKEYLLQLIEINPLHSNGLRLLGVAFAHEKNWDKALEFLNKSISINRSDPISYSNLGNILVELEHYDQALSAFDRSLNIDPNYAEAWLNKGNCLYKLKNYDASIYHYDVAIKLNPTYVEAISNKANSLTQLKKYGEAIPLYKKAISFKPTYIEAWANMANCLGLANDHNEALRCAKHAILIDSKYIPAWITLGKIYDESGLPDISLESYKQAYLLDSNFPFLEGIIFRFKQNLGQWENYSSSIEKIKIGLNNNKRVLPPHALLSILDDPILQLKASEIFTNSEYKENDALGVPPKHINEKIRIGYFSSDFKDHPVSHLTVELFELHNRNQFEIYGFSTKQGEPSLIRDRLLDAFDHFLEVHNKSDFEIASLARSLKIDIAVDLGGYTQDARTEIFAYRAAPIQVNYLGFAGTMGSSYMDYIIADQIVIPREYKDCYSEKKAYLPNTYMVDDSKRIPSDKQFTRSDFDLPEDQFIFCCFNNSYKFNPSRVASFAKILTRTPNSILWVSENNSSFKKNLLDEFAKLAIPEERIIFAKRIDSLEDHLARYRLADLFLDTYPYNAHTTALDSLKAGVPIISMAGKTFASRVGASLLTAIGLPELITYSEEEFVDLACKFGSHSQLLQSLKHRLTQNYSTMPLFNTRLFCKHLEFAYQNMHRRHLNNMPTSDIYITN